MISSPIPRYTRASLRQVGVSSLTPLPCGVVVVETVALNPLVQGVTHTHTHGVFWACLRPWTPTNRPEEVRGRAFWAGRHQQGAGWLSEGHRRPKHEPERVDSDRSD